MNDWEKNTVIFLSMNSRHIANAVANLIPLIDNALSKRKKKKTHKANVVAYFQFGDPKRPSTDGVAEKQEQFIALSKGENPFFKHHSQPLFSKLIVKLFTK
jgi:hypothetical protein